MGRCVGLKGVPLEAVEIVCPSCSPARTYSESDGTYEFYAQKNDTVVLTYQIAEFEEIRSYIIDERKYYRIPDVKFNYQLEDSIIVRTKHNPTPFELPTVPFSDIQNLPLGSVERYITYTQVANSNNELSSNYTVRGGNYDENLVYVNGFLIYRPFLTRSGQQEGMSFINSALVQSIRFSGGGFDSQYGDKLSSVLDIDYKTPQRLKASAMASLLGVEAHVEQSPSARFNYLVGARYRANGYLLNSLPTKGTYNPVFWDAQFLTNYSLTENLTWSVIGHFSSNDYSFAPQTSETDFGTANEAYSFKIYFDGQEQTRFQTMMGGTSLKWNVNKNTKLDFYATVFNTNEKEYYDIQGQYFINELETDPSKEEYGDSIAVLGIGTFLNHGRNKLNATIINIYENGQHILASGYTDDSHNKFRSHTLNWGISYQHDVFDDVLSEWKMIDSAGYSLPQTQDDQVNLYETIKGKLNLQTDRFTSFAQMSSIWSKVKKDFIVTIDQKKKIDGKKELVNYTDTIRESASRWALNVGTRGGYTTINQEAYLTPRASIVYYPRMYLVNKGKIVRRDINFKLASGFYYQPPFYREFRTYNGQLNLDVKSQKSMHVVAGTEVFFNMWDREMPFKFNAELYYKYLWDVNPYEIENVRTRYYAENNAVAYAYGLDLNIHGEFVEGIQSSFKMGFMSTKEDILNDFYKEYYNASGEKIIFGHSDDQVVVDSATIYPGYVPRPTDQLMYFGALVQDRMPGFESFSVQMGMQFGTPLPYGPPDFTKYKDTLRMKSYFRVDIGMSYDFLYKKKEEKNFFNKHFTDAILSFEVFNLLGINNVLSKQWIQDTQGIYYSIPNYLTQRRFNLKMILRF